MAAIAHSYLEKSGDGAKKFSHLSIYQRTGGFALEEVSGLVEPDSARRGEIRALAEALSRDEAQARYQDEISARRSAGYLVIR